MRILGCVATGVVGLAIGLGASSRVHAGFLDGIASLLGGKKGRLPDRTTEALLTSSQVEAVHGFSYPPGHISMSQDGRIFVDAFVYGPKDSKKREYSIAEVVPSTFNTEGSPESQIVIDGVTVTKPTNYVLKPFPSLEIQKQFRAVHTVTVDKKRNWLWVNDNDQISNFSSGGARVWAFDLETGEVRVRHEMKSKFGDEPNPHAFQSRRPVRVDRSGRFMEAGKVLNDLVLDYVHDLVFISNSCPHSTRKCSIIVYDIKKNQSFEILEGDRSVTPAENPIFVEDKKMELLWGLYLPTIGVDGLTIDHEGKYIYYSPTTSGVLYRLAIADILEFGRSNPKALGSRVEKFADITMSDGMKTDRWGNIYITDYEHSAVVRLTPNGKLETVFKNKNLCPWPMHLAFSPNEEWAYVTCTKLHLVSDPMVSDEEMIEKGPYYVLRFPMLK